MNSSETQTSLLIKAQDQDPICELTESIASRVTQVIIANWAFNIEQAKERWHVTLTISDMREDGTRSATIGSYWTATSFELATFLKESEQRTYRSVWVNTWWKQENTSILYTGILPSWTQTSNLLEDELANTCKHKTIDLESDLLGQILKSDNRAILVYIWNFINFAKTRAEARLNIKEDNEKPFYTDTGNNIMMAGSSKQYGTNAWIYQKLRWFLMNTPHNILSNDGRFIITGWQVNENARKIVVDSLNGRRNTYVANRRIKIADLHKEVLSVLSK